jgi:hypothetical protein
MINDTALRGARYVSDAEVKLDAIEGSIRRFNRANEIVFILLTANERGVTLYDSLIKVENIVKGLNDELLSSLYSRLFEGKRTFVPKYQQIRQIDYSAFLQRLGMLLYEIIVEVNEADIALKEAIGLEAVIGVWGGKDWRPTGEL